MDQENLHTLTRLDDGVGQSTESCPVRYFRNRFKYSIYIFTAIVIVNKPAILINYLSHNLKPREFSYLKQLKRF